MEMEENRMDRLIGDDSWIPVFLEIPESTPAAGATSRSVHRQDGNRNQMVLFLDKIEEGCFEMDETTVIPGSDDIKPANIPKRRSWKSTRDEHPGPIITGNGERQRTGMN